MGRQGESLCLFPRMKCCLTHGRPIKGLHDQQPLPRNRMSHRVVPDDEKGTPSAPRFGIKPNYGKGLDDAHYGEVKLPL